MILNVSGRTDIIAFYTPWFINRLKEGFVDVRNPFNPHQVSRINFSSVDMFVFCTKNPHPIIKYLSSIKKPILFHVTLTGYHNDIETGVPNKRNIINDIKKISNILGKDYVYIRYDPIFLNDKYTIDYHIKAIEKLCFLLTGYIDKIIISFIDSYKNTRKNIKYREFTQDDYKVLGSSLYQIIKKYNIRIHTCFEKENLSKYGLPKEECLSHELAYILTGKKFPEWKARKEQKCHCVQLVDIGTFNTCPHFCKYCYANYDEDKVLSNMKLHNPNSSLLIGELEKDDIVTIRTK